MMKRFFAFVAVCCLSAAMGAAVAQDYDAERGVRQTHDSIWHEVDSLIENQYYDDAYRQALLRYDHYCGVRDLHQMLVGATYLNQIGERYREEVGDTALMRYNALLPQLEGVEHALCCLFVADFYVHYMNRNNWSIRQRKPSDDPGVPYTEWDADRLIDTILVYTRQAFAQPQLLTATPAYALYPLAELTAESWYHENRYNNRPADSLGVSCWNSTPTCYDAMVRNVQELYRDLCNMDFVVTVGLSDLLLTPEAFVAASGDGPSKFSLFMIGLIQQQEAAALREGDELLLLRRYLQRCELPAQKTETGRREAYQAAIERFRHLATDDNAREEMAGLYANLVEQLCTNDRVAAQRYIDTVLDRYPGTSGASRCQHVRRTIEQPELSMSMDGVVPTGRDALAYVEVRNVERIYFRIIKEPGKSNVWPLVSSRHYDDKKLRDSRPLRSWCQELPKRDDYTMQQFAVAINIMADGKPLPAGAYILLASNDSTFKSENVYMRFAISRLMLLGQEYDDDCLSGFVVDRSSGLPIKDVQLTLSSQGQHGKTLGSVMTDGNGYYDFSHLIDDIKYNWVNLVVKHGDEKWVVADFYFNHSWWMDHNSRNASTECHFMVDRPVYRPGDTVHFAFLAYADSLRTSPKRLLAGKELTVTLCQMSNYLDLDTLAAVLDGYGSASGTFVIPADITPGDFRLEAQLRDSKKSHYKYISVEAYKQPKFMVSLHADSNARAFGRPVTLEGMAASYSGAPLDGATLKYAVTRTKIMDFGPHYRSYIRPMTRPVAVANGEGVVDADGQFRISFVPLPDSSGSWQRSTRYRYTVSVEVTDRNGESHEAELNIPVGFTSTCLDMEVVPTEGYGMEVRVAHRNLDGTPVPGSVRVEVFALEQPERPLLPLFASDTPEEPSDAPVLLSADEFAARFPLLDRDNSNSNLHRWKVGRRRLVQQADLQGGRPLTVDLGSLPAGAYRVKATLLAGGDDTMSVCDEVVYMPSKARKVADNRLLWSDQGRTSLQVGDTAHIRFGSRFSNLRVAVVVSNDMEQFGHSVYRVDDEVVAVDIPVDERMVGGFTVSLATGLDNRVAAATYGFDVAYPHSELEVSIATFRNKLEPGAVEHWTLRVADKQSGSPLPAAMVMTMYDHSLDHYGSLDLSFSPWNKSGVGFKFRADNPLAYTLNYLDFVGDFSTRQALLEPTGEVVHPCLLYWRLYDGLYGSNWRYAKSDRVMMLGNVRKRTGVKSPLESGTARGEDTELYHEMGEVTEEEAYVSGGEAGDSVDDDAEIVTLLEIVDEEDGGSEEPGSGKEEPQVRSNLSTLAFFAPSLRTGTDGSAEFSFTVPELLTEWTVQGVAWNRDLAVGGFRASVVTQKPLMVVPNVPRFLRHGDTCLLSVKVSNLTDSVQQLCVELTMSDAASGRTLPIVLAATVPGYVDSRLAVPSANKVELLLAPKSSREVLFTLAVPQGGVFVTHYRVVARGERVSDGEQGPIPLLSSRQLVTESMAFYINGAGVKEFALDHLASLDTAAADFTLRHHALSVDLTPNPIWMALQSLPYVAQQRNPSNIFLANAVYANSLSASIVENNPAIGQLFDEWRRVEPDAFMSELDRNAELKQTVISETPWLRDADSEEQRHRDMARFFDRTTLERHIDHDLGQLLDAQRTDGGWSWIAGGRRSCLYTTQYILRTLGLLQQQGVKLDARTRRALDKAMDYVDRETYDYYRRYVKEHRERAADYEPVNLDYLYVRSLFPGNKLSRQQQEAFDFFYGNAKKRNKQFASLYCQSLLALVFDRNGDTLLAQQMATRLLQKSLYSDEMGRYWRDNAGGYCWHERPIETQAMLIRTVGEVLGDYDHVAQMQQWLLKQKQTTRWSSDVATVNAIQALLIQQPKEGALVASPATKPRITLEYGSHRLVTDTARHQLHVGQRLAADEVTPADGRLTIRKEEEGIAWGAMYWQYFEQVEKIPASSMGITLSRKIYRVNTDGTLSLLSGKGDAVKMKVGDKIRVRIDIRCDRNLEYLELKEPRCAALEPVSTTSGWEWNNGLSYYCSITNTAQTLYIDRLSKGSYYVEYDLYVNNGGTYTTAPTTMQCLYAPEFRALCPMPRVEAVR